MHDVLFLLWFNKCNSFPFCYSQQVHLGSFWQAAAKRITKFAYMQIVVMFKSLLPVSLFQSTALSQLSFSPFLCSLLFLWALLPLFVYFHIAFLSSALSVPICPFILSSTVRVTWQWCFCAVVLIPSHPALGYLAGQKQLMFNFIGAFKVIGTSHILCLTCKVWLPTFYWFCINQLVSDGK